MKVSISDKKRRRKTLPYFGSGAIAAIGTPEASYEKGSDGRRETNGGKKQKIKEARVTRIGVFERDTHTQLEVM